MATYSKRDITLTEEREEISALGLGEKKVHTYWIATFDGRLSSGESVSASRDGDTAEAARSRLVEVMAEQGWEQR